MSNRTRRTDCNPETVYAALGPITPEEMRNLDRMGKDERDRWLANIYGQTTARYARTIWQAHTRTSRP
jgi:hypothetical protein